MHTVIAEYVVKTGHADVVASILAEHAADSLREMGCVQFVVLRDTKDSSRFLLFEQYDDVRAFEAHRQTRHFRENIEERVAPLLEQRRWQVYAVVEPRV